jgi:carboxyl-terminal processing protease
MILMSRRALLQLAVLLALVDWVHSFTTTRPSTERRLQDKSNSEPTTTATQSFQWRTVPVRAGCNSRSSSRCSSKRSSSRNSSRNSGSTNGDCEPNLSSITTKLIRDSKALFGTIVLTCLLVLQPWSIQSFPTTMEAPLPSDNSIVVVGGVPFHRSSAWALNDEQALIDEVWREVTRQLVDPTFGGQGEDAWRQKRLDAVKQATTLTPDDRQQGTTYDIIRSMLKSLKDPYTRYLTPDQYESLTNYATGRATTGIGVQLLGDPTTGDIVVVQTVTGGPAEQAGILPGDIIVEIDGTSVNGATAEVVAAKCRGTAGSQVTVIVRHDDGGGTKKDDGKKSQTTKQTSIDVTRGTIPTVRVQVSTFPASSPSSKQGTVVGLIKLSSFNSQETTQQVEEGIAQLRAKKVSALVIDLRGNAGGYMPAGVDVAKLFVPPQTLIVSEVDKKGRATLYVKESVGTSETDLPLYLLVDQRTASASEIMAAALQDNHRATIVSADKSTFGKGRIQNVVELSEGGIAVTKAKYITPAGRDIQGVGLVPDQKLTSCEATDAASVCLKDIL